MPSKRKLLAFIVTAIVGVSVVIGFFNIGSPGNERLRRYDDQRSQNLQSLRYGGIDEYVRRNGSLPDSLEEIQKTIALSSPDSLLTDPKTGEPFEYAKLSETTFSLCATFDLPSEPNAKTMYPDVMWVHPAGRTCFKFQIQSTGPTVKNSVPIP